MKILFYGSISAALGLAYAATIAPRVLALIHPTDSRDPLSLGIAAVTGKLALDAIALDSRPAVAPPVTLPALTPALPVAPAKPVPPRIVAAWGDEAGRVFVRFADGSTARRLESGDLVKLGD